ITVSGLLTWTGGTMEGSGATDAQGGLQITANYQALGRVLNNAAAATLGGSGYLYFGTSASEAGGLNNLAGATFDIGGDASLYPYHGDAALNNYGTLEKSAGTGASTIGIALNSSGSVLVQSGTLSLGGGGSASGSFSVSGGATLAFGG